LALLAATALTAKSIADGVRRFVVSDSNSSRKQQAFREMILSGGGAKNSTLVGILTDELGPLGVQLRFSDEFGLPSAAKEAAAQAKSTVASAPNPVSGPAPVPLIGPEPSRLPVAAAIVAGVLAILVVLLARRHSED